jgi:acyl phosphate:glycerol-3-phosphate acyltransferase
MTMASAAMVIVAGFLIGSIPFPYLLTRRRGVDLRTVGSGNVGAANVLRVSSPATAVTVLALDATKGSVAVWMAQALTPQNSLAVCAGLAAVAGHVYPPWLGFRGGKGMATAAGVFAVLAPAATAVSTVVFIVVLVTSRYVSLGSLGAMLALPPLTAWFGASMPVLLGACATVAFTAFRHRANMRRLWLGTEQRVGQRP